MRQINPLVPGLLKSRKPIVSLLRAVQLRDRRRGRSSLAPKRGINPLIPRVAEAWRTMKTGCWSSKRSAAMILPSDNCSRSTKREVVRLAFKFLHDQESAEDATQDIFLKVWRSLSSFRGESAFHTWLTAIAVNHCNTAWQRNRGRRTVSAFGSPDSEGDAILLSWLLTLDDLPATPENILVRKELGDVLRLSIAELPPKERNVFVLAKIEGRTESQIAGLLKIPIGTVRSRMARALKQVSQRVRARVSSQEHR